MRHVVHGHGVMRRAHHVAHRQPDTGIHGRHGRDHAFARCERTPRVTGAVDGLGEHRVRTIIRFDQNVISLGDRNAELVDGDRIDVLSIRRDHGHLQAGDAYVEDR